MVPLMVVDPPPGQAWTAQPAPEHVSEPHAAREPLPDPVSVSTSPAMKPPLEPRLREPLRLPWAAAPPMPPPVGSGTMSLSWRGSEVRGSRPFARAAAVLPVLADASTPWELADCCDEAMQRSAAQPPP